MGQFERIVYCGHRTAKGKSRWQKVRQGGEKNENPCGDMVNMRVSSQDEISIPDEKREQLERRRVEIEEEIGTSYRPQKVRNYLRLLALLYEEGKLTQNKETAEKAQVSLKTLQTFLSEGRQKGWFQH